MPPERKPLVEKLEDMICKNCIYYVKDAAFPYRCINPDSDDWDVPEINTCSKGEWICYSNYGKKELIILEYFRLYRKLIETGEDCNHDQTRT